MVTRKPDPARQQIGARVDTELVVAVRVLAAQQRRRFNDLVDEALRGLLKKYKVKGS